MSDSSRQAADLFSREARRREDVLADFEQAWFHGQAPEIEEFLRRSGADRRLLVELVHADLEFRLKDGQPVRVEAYLRRFPALSAHRRDVVELIAREFELRARAHPLISPAEYWQRFPDYAAELRAVLPGAVRSEPEPTAEPQAARDGAVVIRVIEGPHRGLEYHCRRYESLVVGRGRDAGLRLNRDPYFSRYHFRLEMAPPVCVLADLDSRNGTFVNGERVRRVFLQDGDVISGGDTRIALTIPAAAGAEPTTAGPPTRGPEAVTRLPAIPGYDLLADLGSGGIGRVYRAVHKATRETVAVKLITPARPADHEAVRQFIREAGLLRQLNHPGLVRLREVGLTDGGLPFLVTEYVASIPRDEALATRSEAERIRIACGIACRVLDALGQAHMQSLVHRGVKPSNVLFARHGRKLHVKLSDFGLARNFMAVGLSSVAHADADPATVAFLPPEQIRDCRFAKPTCDLYAAGVILYRDLCGRFPFEFPTGCNPDAVVLNEEPTPLDRRTPHLPPPLVAAVHRAIAREPGERFLTAHEMRDALRPFSR